MTASSSDLGNKLFGHCEVEWQIDNFSLQTSSKEWFIQSPEFTINGSEKTNWCMDLRSEIINGTSCAIFNLRRCAVDSGPKCTWLNLRMYYGRFDEKYVCCSDMLLSLENQCFDGNYICCCEILNSLRDGPFDRKQICCRDKLMPLKNGSKYEVCLGEIEYLLSRMDRLSNLFTVICDMIVYSNSESRVFGECSRAELKLLSENMLELYRSARHFDTKLLFDDNIILAHKAILFARCEISGKLDDAQERQQYTNINLVDKFDYAGMKKYLAYVYSGDIRHVLEEPSFAIYYCAVFLGIREIENHYKPDKIILKSTIDIQEYTYTLYGYKFVNSRFSWCSDPEKTTKTCHLHFYPERGNKSHCIPLFTETFERLMKASLEFDFFYKRDHLGNISFTTYTFRCFDIDEIVEEYVSKFHSGQRISKVIIKLKITANAKASYVRSHSSVHVTCLNADLYYICFSEDMYNMWDGEILPDVLIQGRYPAHKCVLASRCQFFSDILMRSEGEELVIPNIEDYTVLFLLEYIYSGSYSSDDDEDAIDVYKGAVMLNLPQLKSMCFDLLKVSSKTNRELRCRTVSLAEEFADAPLLNSVLKCYFDQVYRRINERY